MEFKKYMHVERFGTTEVEGIEVGECYIFPKIDGTNSSVWLDDNGNIKAGSRKRELTLEQDNAGFYNAVINDDNIKAFLNEHPNLRLYGEWLVPHSLKTYSDNAWRKFYVFDVSICDSPESEHYLHYNDYTPLLEEFNIEYIPPIKIIINGSYENFVKELDNNTYLIKDGQGCGEGIVIKNYDFHNKFGRQIWAKIVASEFKTLHAKTMSAPVVEYETIEQKIVDKYVTPAFIEKEYCKIVNDNNGWNTKLIGTLIASIYKTFLEEEIFNIVKSFKAPIINFKNLHCLTVNKIKQVKKELF